VTERHEFNHVEVEDDQLLLVCECGRRSPPSADAATIGMWWDEHHRSAPAPS
jgi:hypothetical protein